MDGIHDMGGMHGFGPVPYVEDDTPFHEDWERRVFGMSFSATRPTWASLDYSRHTQERIPPDIYLSSSYYERWLYALIMRQVEAGHITVQEVASGQAQARSTPRSDAMTPEAVDAFRFTPFRQDIDTKPRFSIGDHVLTADLHTEGHTRLPRYARNKEGVIHLHHGAHVLPDTNAHGLGESHTHLYTVKFTARALWGPEGNPLDHTYVDVWECHLEKA